MDEYGMRAADIVAAAKRAISRNIKSWQQTTVPQSFVACLFYGYKNGGLLGQLTEKVTLPLPSSAVAGPPLS